MSENPTEPPVSEPIVAPMATQEPTPEAPIPPSTSEQVEVPPEALESPTEAEDTIPLNNPSDAEAMAGKDNEHIEPVESETPTPEQTAQIEEVEENQPVSVAPEPVTAQIPVIEPFVSQDSRLGWLAKAREAIQFKKRKKLEKIMSIFLKQSSVTNDDVQKLLYVSDATATRYLKQLETERRIRRQGVPGHASYSRI